METEVLDEMVLQPANHDQEHSQIRDQERQHGLEDMDSCMVRKHIYVCDE